MSSPTTQSTDELVARCLRGDGAAWNALVDRYIRLVYSVGVQHGLSAPEVEDVAQETFLALAQTLHLIDDPGRLPSWLMTTARRICWRAVTRRQREMPTDKDDLALDAAGKSAEPLFPTMPSLDEMQDEWHRQETLSMGLARLGARCRALLTMLFLDREEPSYDMISMHIGIPKGSIGPTRTRCLAQLRRILEGIGFDGVF